MADRTQFNMHDAKSNLSRLVERVEAGEEITIARNGKPVARLVPIRSENRFGELIGKWEGQFELPEGWEETPEELIDAFYESKLFPDDPLREGE